jgi:phosphatidylinositol-3-phosphatase
VIPQIEGSAAYKAGGLIAITFAQAPGDTTSCCSQPEAYPNLVTPTETPTATPTATATPTPAGPVGGGRVGLLLISQRIKPNSGYDIGSFNHFSLLRSIEDLFALPHLGYATGDEVPGFDAAVYNGG